MKTCKVEGCNEKHSAKGYCNRHYLQLKSHGIIVQVDRPKMRRCKVEGCNRKHKAKGYCSKHYNQIARVGYILQDK